MFLNITKYNKEHISKLVKRRKGKRKLYNEALLFDLSVNPSSNGFLIVNCGLGLHVLALSSHVLTPLIKTLREDYLYPLQNVTKITFVCLVIAGIMATKLGMQRVHNVISPPHGIKTKCHGGKKGYIDLEVAPCG